jgi:transposase InsO family protein
MPYTSGNRVSAIDILDSEFFDTIEEAKVIIESWRRHYNTMRPRSSIG